ncbi:uncharacterized protein LOC120431284 [Culex pipiens pallens]|uniref:uncharacterized protein LOC120431284 n=1 Tax=Culex pipiens pallens TaxID=42434 RepID=UPI001954DFDC|nr:uncharacterized protein LOC120431284 [Culex pipiens pallens]
METYEDYTDEERLECFDDDETDAQVNDQNAIDYDLDLGDTQMEEDPIATGSDGDVASAGEEDVNATLEEGTHKFRFLANFFVKNYTRQKNGICINAKKNIPEIVAGNSVPEVEQCIWDVVKPYLRREVDVAEANGIEVSWSAKLEPDLRDIEKFVWLKDVKRKSVIRIDALGEGRMLLNWRDKTMLVFAFAYSTSISSLAIWEKMNKHLLQPSDCDRSGAPSNVELNELVHELMEKNQHLEAHHSAWIQWATSIQSSPADEQQELKERLPPASMRGMFFSLPTSEGSRLESTRQGLIVAENILDNLEPTVKILEDHGNHLMSVAFEIKNSAHALAEKFSLCRAMLQGMKMTTAPEETTLSQSHRDAVGDMLDFEHGRKK